MKKAEETFYISLGILSLVGYYLMTYSLAKQFAEKELKKPW